MSLFRLLLIGVSVLAFAGTGHARSRPTPPASALEDPPSAYGQFLAGYAAFARGDASRAAAYFETAGSLESDSGQGAVLRIRAFTAAILAGDIPTAARLAPQGADTPTPLRRMGVLVRAVDQMASGKPKPARALLAGPDGLAGEEVAAGILAPVASAMSGDPVAATTLPTFRDQPIPTFFASLDQGLLYEHFHRFDQAETTYRALIGKGDGGGLATLRLGEMFERRGRRAEAIALYDTAISAKHDAVDLAGARARAVAGRAPPALSSLSRIGSDALLAPATALMLDRQQDIALAYLRLALRLDPTNDEAWMMAGDALQGREEIAAAREAWSRVGPNSPQYPTARNKLAWTYKNAKDDAKALEIARAGAAARPGDREMSVSLADMLRATEHYEESAKLLDAVIAAQGKTPDWRLLYMRAVDYEALGRWDAAEQDVQSALALHPNDAEMMNFLGYSWIDRGRRVDEGLTLVRKAVSLDPQSGAMVDSLGWGYFRVGDYKAAVEQLEAAVVLEPGDPDINDHLGDAYWRVGRKIEAGFQWKRVLTLDPPEKLKAAAEAKLVSGLPEPTAKIIAPTPAF